LYPSVRPAQDYTNCNLNQNFSLWQWNLKG